jgi:hypothetical protein
MTDELGPNESIYPEPESEEIEPPPPRYKQRDSPEAGASGVTQTEQPSLQAYQALQDQFTKAEDELNDMKRRYEMLHKQWKRTGAELNRIHSSGPAFHSVTDDDLIRMAEACDITSGILRFSILTDHR